MGCEIVSLSQKGEVPQALIHYWAALSKAGLSSICASLQPFGINYFLYVKRFNDGSQIELTTHPELSENYYRQSYYTLGPENIKKSYDNGIFLWAGLPHQEVYQHLRETFQVDHGVVIVLKNSDCTEFFYFAGDRNQQNLTGFYLNQQCVLNRFILSFKDNMSDFIEAAAKKRIFVPPGFFYSGEQKHKYFDSKIVDLSEKMPINRYYLNGELSDFYITKREAECLKWHAHGKTAGEISIIINISRRTVEVHLDNVKAKLKCTKQSELGYKFGWLVDLL